MNTIFDNALMDPTAMRRSALAQQNMLAGQAVLNAAQMVSGGVYKETDIAALASATIYGRTSIFDACAAGDIIGLQVQTTGLMNWLGWRPNKFYRKRVDFIGWMGPTGTAAGTPTSAAGAPCADPIGWEYGQAGYEQLHKSWYHMVGEALGPHELGLTNRCETSPRYRLNGKLITDDVEWQMNGITQVLSQQIRRDLIHGSHLNAYEMAGLNTIIKTGYEDENGNSTPELDSILVDWDGDNLDGGVNGFGNFYDYLDEVINEIEYRSSPLGTIAERDMILLVPRFMATALLDGFACYTTCGVTSTTDITDQALRAQQRAERRALNGGPLYDGRNAVGYLHLKSGRRLPIIVEDTIDFSTVQTGAGTPEDPYVNTTTRTSDIYLLTRQIGSMNVLTGEYLDLRTYENAIKRADPKFRGRSDAAGRFVIKGKEDNWCWLVQMGTSPELFYRAPWSMARFQDVAAVTNRRPITGDVYQPNNLVQGGAAGLHVAVPAE